ncbi:hypothetical protein niasHS_013176 [Heterodera schachtii]|uniref:Uncharacterized protein n=1 Tax=Heterodera schachtii TaxID=97005 RepID=A0ABD2IDJ7_HETSC
MAGAICCAVRRAMDSPRHDGVPWPNGGIDAKQTQRRKKQQQNISSRRMNGEASFPSSLPIIPSLSFTIPSRFVLLTTGDFFLSFCGLSFPKPNGGFHC